MLMRDYLLCLPSSAPIKHQPTFFLSLSADLMVYSFKIRRPVARRRSPERSGGSGRNVVTERSITMKQGVLSRRYHFIFLLILNVGNL